MFLDCKHNKATMIVCATSTETGSPTVLEVGGSEVIYLFLSPGFWGCNMSSCSVSYRCVTPAFIVTWPSILFVWLPLFVRTLAILIMGLLYSSMTSSLLITIAISYFQTRHMIKFHEGHAFGGHQSSLYNLKESCFH